MPCAVYCLVSNPAELDPLVERLKDAGVETRDIAVIPRAAWQAFANSSGPWLPTDSPTYSLSSFASTLWGLPLASAALWWEWTGVPCPFAPGQALAAAGRRAGKGSAVVIPLAAYEAQRQKMNRK